MRCRVGRAVPRTLERAAYSCTVQLTHGLPTRRQLFAYFTPVAARRRWQQQVLAQVPERVCEHLPSVPIAMSWGPDLECPRLSSPCPPLYAFGRGTRFHLHQRAREPESQPAAPPLLCVCELTVRCRC